jgi:hypothetical protein
MAVLEDVQLVLEALEEATPEDLRERAADLARVWSRRAGHSKWAAAEVETAILSGLEALPRELRHQVVEDVAAELEAEQESEAFPTFRRSTRVWGIAA